MFQKFLQKILKKFLWRCASAEFGRDDFDGIEPDEYQ